MVGFVFDRIFLFLNFFLVFILAVYSGFWWLPGFMRDAGPVVAAIPLVFVSGFVRAGILVAKKTNFFYRGYLIFSFVVAVVGYFYGVMFYG